MIEYTVKVFDDRKEWYLDGKHHREDGPAVEHSDGSKEWYLNGNYHREDGPAIEGADGSKYWYLNGLAHREDGPAVEYSCGDTVWYLNGKIHREDGPAVEYNNFYKEWCYKEWWLDGVIYTEEEFNKKMNPVKELSVEEISKLLGYEVKVVKG